MHLVFVTSIVPDGAPSTGYEIANAAIVGALRRAGARVTVLGFAWPGRAPADPESTVLLGEVDVRTDNAGPVRKLRWLARALAEGQTFSSVKLRAAGEAAVRAALRRIGAFDAYVLNAVQLAGAYPAVFRDRPSIFVAHNVEFRSAAENAEAARTPVERFMFRRESRLLEKLETGFCRRADFVFTLAEEDRAALGVADDTRSAALPLVTRETLPVPSAPASPLHDACLIGTWTWQPNRIGLDWFLEKVVPRLKPGFRIAIAGATPAGMRSSHPGVSFVGRVEDAPGFVMGAAVVPLVSRAGTGVQLKTIETFELGLPSVATSHALRGIAWRPENCAVADDPEEFARMLEEKAAHRGPRADGALFHRRQRAVLDEKVRLGLAALGHRAARAAA